MLDLHHFRRRERELEKLIGVRNRDILEESKTYSVYYNPSTWIMTGIKDNERNVFYDYRKQEDFIKFVDALNVKEKNTSEFLKGIEFSLKSFTDREIEFFEKIDEIDSKKQKLDVENKQLKTQITIFDEFLWQNDLDIDWMEFCSLDNCVFNDEEHDCKECVHLKFEVER